MYTDKNDMGLRARVPGVASELVENSASGNGGSDAGMRRLLGKEDSVNSGGGSVGGNARMRRLLGSESGNGGAAKVPAQYTASSYEELIPQLERRMADFKPLTKEELEKLRRRQKAEGIIGGISDAVRSVANLIAASQYAPDMYDPKDGMTVKAKERFDKEKAQREADADKFFNYAMTIGKMRDADKDRGLRAWQAEQTLAREDRAHDEQKRQWQESFDRQGEWRKEDGEQRDRQFNEGVRQFNETKKIERRRIDMEAKRIANELKKGQMTFSLGSGNGNVTLTADRLNAQTVSRIFNTLPKEVRDSVEGEPIVKNGFIVGHKDPTTEAMLIAIGANVESSPATQNAIRQVAGLERGKKPKAY